MHRVKVPSYLTWLKQRNQFLAPGQQVYGETSRACALDIFTLGTSTELVLILVVRYPPLHGQRCSNALPLMGNWFKVNQTTLFSGFFVSSLIAGTWRGKGPMSGLGTDDEVKM